MLATALLSANDFEFGRYADTLLNVFLAVTQHRLIGSEFVAASEERPCAASSPR